jgi:hypothetical protein
MLALYPNLIPVALHSYTNSDAMDFAQIDTIDAAYTQGAPLAAIDRICSASSSNQTAVFVNTWNTKIQQRLSVPAVLALNIIPSWNSSTRNITAQVSINIISNMSSGDYRLSLYVVEDSVTGIGAGYDQESFYDADASSPFYGMGNPIVGFIHKHAVRAMLSSSWGLQGLIPSAPVTGQNFNYTFNYTLPVSYNENRVHLVAFVYRFTSNHTGDEVLNVADEKLLQAPSAVFNYESMNNGIKAYSYSQQIIVELDKKMESAAIALYDVAGRETKNLKNISGNRIIIDAANISGGIYFYRIMDRNKKTYCGKMMLN